MGKDRDPFDIIRRCNHEHEHWIGFECKLCECLEPHGRVIDVHELMSGTDQTASPGQSFPNVNTKRKCRLVLVLPLPQMFNVVLHKEVAE